MAPPTLRHTAALAGVDPPLSFCRDVLGLAQATVPDRLNTGHDVPAVSLAATHDRLHLTSFDLALILAGSDLMTAADLTVIDFAVWRTREIYAAAGITLGRVGRTLLPAADAGGHDTVTTDDEISAAGRALTVPGRAVPVVLPAAMNVSVTENGMVSTTLGRSPVPGDCGDRDDRGAMRSAVVMINGEGTARTLAHEIGHFLGCRHRNDETTTLMCQTGSATGDPYHAVGIPAGDAGTMGAHCALGGVPGSDVRSYDPADFTVEELETAARAGGGRISGPLAVTVLRAKLGDRAADALVRLAADDGVDVRARQTATLALADFPDAAPALRRLAASAPDRVARAATRTLETLDRRTT